MKYPDELKTKVKELYLREGIPFYEVAHQVKIHPDTAYEWLKREGCLRRAGETLHLNYVRKTELGTTKKAKLLSQVKDLYIDQGISAPKVGEQLGINPDTVYRWLREDGCHVRNLKESHPSKLGQYRKYKWEYIKVYKPDHPRSQRDGYVLEHILVWEETHGRPLPKGWVVHHLNGIKNDNRPDNLLALPFRKHSLLIPIFQEKIRRLEVENRQLRRALENNQSIFYISEN